MTYNLADAMIIFLLTKHIDHADFKNYITVFAIPRHRQEILLILIIFLFSIS